MIKEIDFKKFFVKNKNNLILAAIMLVGIFFRFRGLINQGGLILGDEETYLSIARSIRGSINFLYDFVISGSDISGIREQAMDYFSNGFKIATITRPGYILLISIPIVFFGAYDFIPLIVNASLSVASIYLVFLVAKEITKRDEIGLLSALLFSLSGYSIFWARSAMAQTSTAFFLILGILFYLYSLRDDVESRSDYYFKLSALTFGFLFTTHYSVFIFLFLIFCFDFFRAYKKKNLLIRYKKAIIFFLLPILFFQLISLIYSFALNNLGYNSGSVSYFAEIIQVSRTITDFIPAFSRYFSFWAYFKFLIVFDGILTALLMMFFLPLFIYKKWYTNYRYIFLLLIFFLPFVFYSAVKLKTEYNFVMFLPLLSVVGGISLWTMFEIIRNSIMKKIVLFLLITAVIILGLKNSLIFSSFTNHYQDVAEYFERQGNIDAICGTRTGIVNTEFYLNDFFMKNKDNDCDNAQYAILDWAMAYFPETRNQFYDIIDKKELVLEYNGSFADYLCPQLKWEDDISNCREDSLLRVYKLQ